jgi:hypothetical protein
MSRFKPIVVCYGAIACNILVNGFFKMLKDLYRQTSKSVSSRKNESGSSLAVDVMKSFRSNLTDLWNKKDPRDYVPFYNLCVGSNKKVFEHSLKKFYAKHGQNNVNPLEVFIACYREVLREVNFYAPLFNVHSVTHDKIFENYSLIKTIIDESVRSCIITMYPLNEQSHKLEIENKELKETIEKIKTEKSTKQGEENGELGMTVFDDWSEIGSVNGDESVINVSQPRSQYKQNQNQNNPVQIVMSDDEEEEEYEEDPSVSIDRLSSILNK